MFTKFICCEKEVRIQPCVVMSILRYFSRRDEGSKVMFGTLLGKVRDSYVTVTNIFPNQYSINSKTGLKTNTVNKDLHNKFSEVFHKIYEKRREKTLGYFVVSMEGNEKPNEIDQELYKFFSEKTKKENTGDPILLKIDPYFQREMVAYFCRGIKLGGVVTGMRFVETRLSYVSTAAETNALGLVMRDIEVAKNTYYTNYEYAVKKILEMVKVNLHYLKKVKLGEVKGDVEVGKVLYESLRILSISLVEDDYKRSFEEKKKEILTVMYLSKVAQNQMVMFDKMLQRKKPKLRKSK